MDETVEVFRETDNPPEKKTNKLMVRTQDSSGGNLHTNCEWRKGEFYNDHGDLIPLSSIDWYAAQDVICGYIDQFVAKARNNA